MAVTIYYVDPVNGSNLNDGLTPANALADIFLNPGRTVVETAEFWVRRDTTIDVSAGQTLYYAKVFGWPSVGDHMYDSRPVDGQAAWDTDADIKPILNVTANITIDMRNADTDMAFSNFDIDDSGSSIPLFWFSYGDLVFTNCTINSTRTDSHNGSIVQSSKTGTAPLTYISNVYFTDCTIDISGTLWSTDASYGDYTKHATLDNTIFNGVRVFDLYDAGVNQKHGTNYLNIVNGSDIRTSRVVSIGLFSDASGTGYYHLNYENSSFICSSSATEIYNSATIRWNAYAQYSFSAAGCTFDVNGHIFHGATASDTNGRWGYIKKFVFTDNTVLRASTVLYVQSGYTHTYCRIYNQCDHIITNNYFDLSGSVVTWYRSGGATIYFDAGYEVIMIGNNYANTAYLHYTNAGFSAHPDKLTLFEKNMSLSASLHNIHFDNCDINLTNCNINGTLGAFGKGYASLSLVDIHGITAALDVDIRYSTISGAPAINNPKNLLARNCIIQSPTSPINLNGGSATLIDCDIQNDFDVAIGGSTRCYNSLVNTINTAYVSNENGIKKSISGTYRQGGSNGTIEYSSTLNSRRNATFDSITGTMEAGKTAASIFFASENDFIASGTAIEINMIIILDGSPVVIPCILEEDVVSQWDGLVANIKRYKATATLAGGYDIDTEYGFFLATHLGVDVPKSMFFDLDAVFAV